MTKCRKWKIVLMENNLYFKKGFFPLGSKFIFLIFKGELLQLFLDVLSTNNCKTYPLPSKHKHSFNNCSKFCNFEDHVPKGSLRRFIAWANPRSRTRCPTLKPSGLEVIPHATLSFKRSNKISHPPQLQAWLDALHSFEA